MNLSLCFQDKGFVMMENHHSALWLSAVIIAVFALQNFVSNFTNAFILDTSLAAIRPWTLFTSIFLHGDVVHLLYNLFGLIIFGLILENLIGTKRFLLVFFSAGIFASIVSLFFYSRVLGASGAIFGILGCVAVLKPKLTVWVGGIPMPMWLAAIVWLIVDIIRFNLPTGIASGAHIAGLLLGLAFGFYWKPKKQKPPKINLPSENEIRLWEKTWMK